MLCQHENAHSVWTQSPSCCPSDILAFCVPCCHSPRSTVSIKNTSLPKWSLMRIIVFFYIGAFSEALSCESKVEL